LTAPSPQLRYTTAQGGKNRYQASQLWGRTWDGGDITLGYEWYDDSAIMNRDKSKMSVNYSPWGFGRQDAARAVRSPARSPPVRRNDLSTAASRPTSALTAPTAGPFRTGTGGNFNPALNGGVGPTRRSVPRR
jgi:hypothetical protein